MKPILTILLLLLFGKANTQTCTGSVGDPLVNITFGAGSSAIGKELSSETTTNLTFVDSVCPEDGQYTIINQSVPCFANSWYPLTDHTGDNNGYFMLVNASEEPSTFYIQKIDGLCTGTTFQFAVWIANLCNFTNTILPNITLTIESTDGTVLSTYNTGDIPVNVSRPEWKQYKLNFTTPVGLSSVVLRMRNNQPGGIDHNGNDLAIDDITFRPVGPAISFFARNFSDDSAIVCSKDTKNIEFQSNIEQCYSNTAYQWQVSKNNGLSWSDIPGEVGSIYNRTQTAAGIYLYRLTAAQSGNIDVSTCRVVSKSFKVLVYDPDSRTISIEASINPVCESNPVTFTAHTTLAGSSPVFQWMINSQAVGNNDSTFTTNLLTTEDKVSCTFTSSLLCVSPKTSDNLSITVLKKARALINKSICEGNSYEGYTASGTYIDVFTGSNGCDSIRTLMLVVYPKQHTMLDTTICFGASYLGLTKDGSYSYNYTDIHGCDSVHTINLNVLPNTNPRPYIDTVLCSGGTLILSPGIYNSYLWQDGSTGSTYRVSHSGVYRVTVTDKCGSAIKITAVHEKLCIIDFPSAFTPNGDGRNEVFKAVNAYDLARYHYIIFNRWGQKIFEISDPRKGWDGTVNGRQSEVGTYIWWCEYQRNGEPQPVRIKGTVTLLR